MNRKILYYSFLTFALVFLFLALSPFKIKALSHNERVSQVVSISTNSFNSGIFYIDLESEGLSLVGSPSSSRFILYYGLPLSLFDGSTQKIEFYNNITDNFYSLSIPTFNKDIPTNSDIINTYFSGGFGSFTCSYTLDSLSLSYTLENAFTNCSQVSPSFPPDNTSQGSLTEYALTYGIDKDFSSDFKKSFLWFNITKFYYINSDSISDFLFNCSLINQYKCSVYHNNNNTFYSTNYTPISFLDSYYDFSNTSDSPFWFMSIPYVSFSNIQNLSTISNSLGRSYIRSLAYLYENLPNESDFFSGYESGYESGYTIGNSDGYESGYESGYDFGYDSGYTIGNSEGYDSGYTIGNSDGILSTTNYYENIISGYDSFNGWTWVLTLFNIFSFLFSINIAPNLTFGMVLMIPITISLITFILKMAKGGQEG